MTSKMDRHQLSIDLFTLVLNYSARSNTVSLFVKHKFFLRSYVCMYINATLARDSEYKSLNPVSK